MPPLFKRLLCKTVGVSAPAVLLILCPYYNTRYARKGQKISSLDGFFEEITHSVKIWQNGSCTVERLFKGGRLASWKGGDARGRVSNVNVDDFICNAYRIDHV